MTLEQRGELVVARFFEAMDTLEKEHSNREILSACGIDRRNYFKKREAQKGSAKIPASWLSVLCDKYRVSPEWLLLGRGKMFGK